MFGCMLWSASGGWPLTLLFINIHIIILFDTLSNGFIHMKKNVHAKKLGSMRYVHIRSV